MRATGAALDGLGINVDLAPVADVPRSTGSFMYQQGRTFSFGAATHGQAGGRVRLRARVERRHGDHEALPGDRAGDAGTRTDVVTITASTGALAAGLRPYRTAIEHDIPLIMLSNATYTAYDPATRRAGRTRSR